MKEESHDQKTTPNQKCRRRKSKKADDDEQECCECKTIECEHRIIESEVGILECKNNKHDGMRVNICFCLHLECAFESPVFVSVFESAHEC